MDIQKFSEKYSILTKNELSKEKYIINETLQYLKNNFSKYKMFVASGADENDLRDICCALNLNQYFISINGSPTVKSEIVKKLMTHYILDKSETILIGDSINDYEAAYDNHIGFYGFNNEMLRDKHKYIETMSEFEKKNL